MLKTSRYEKMVDRFGGTTSISHLNRAIETALTLEAQSQPSMVVKVQLNVPTIKAIIKSRHHDLAATWIVIADATTLLKSTQVKATLEWSKQQWLVVIYTDTKMIQSNGDYDQSFSRRSYPLS